MEATVVSNADSPYLLDHSTPVITRRDGSVVYTFPETREGWIQALQVLNCLNKGEAWS